MYWYCSGVQIAKKRGLVSIFPTSTEHCATRLKVQALKEYFPIQAGLGLVFSIRLKNVQGSVAQSAMYGHFPLYVCK